MVTDIKGRGGEGRGGEGSGGKGGKEREGEGGGGKGREGKGRGSQVIYQAAHGLTSHHLQGMEGSNKYPKQTGKPACKTKCCS